MNIGRIRIVLPSRLRGNAEAAGRAIAERIAADLARAGPDVGESRLSVTVPGQGRPASMLARDAAGALARNTGGRSWR